MQESLQAVEPLFELVPGAAVGESDVAVRAEANGVKIRAERLVLADAQERVPPEDIFDYIYGVLHSPAYRAKFKEFLKSDFPRIPYPKDAAEFARFRDAGRALRETHLMRDAAPREP